MPCVSTPDDPAGHGERTLSKVRDFTPTDTLRRACIAAATHDCTQPAATAVGLLFYKLNPSADDLAVLLAVLLDECSSGFLSDSSYDPHQE